jgi:hypothetical protein
MGVSALFVSWSELEQYSHDGGGELPIASDRPTNRNILKR